MLESLFRLVRPQPIPGADPEAQLEHLDPNGWEGFTGSELAVLILCKTTCPMCHCWSEELAEFLEQGGAEWTRGVRFAKLPLDQTGYSRFKRGNPWIQAEVKELPYNIIYASGERRHGYAGGGIGRLARRLKRIARKHAPHLGR